MLARGFLRHVVSSGVGVGPSELVIMPTAVGRPVLAGPWRRWPSFNVTHTDALVAIAVSPVGKVGIDAEIRRSVPQAVSIARRVLASDEFKVLSAWCPGLPADRFTACWVRKEVIAKALGCGLALDLASFSVTLPPRPPRIVRAPVGTQVNRWQMHELALAADHVAVLATFDGPTSPPRVRQGVPYSGWDALRSG